MGYIIIPYLLFLIPYDILAYPVFGTKRYGRTANPLHNWAVSNPVQLPSYYYLPRSHYPLNYYDAMSPYAQEYTDEYYYPQENLNYPVYYPVRGPKYDYYQPAVPYYYDGRHYPRYYYDEDPVEDIQEEIQEEEREQREEALPVGQETWYENDDTQSDDSIDDINAAFLQNLMLYNDAMSNKNYDYPQQDYLQNYNEDIMNWNDEMNKKYEDEDVKELKMLAGKPKKQKNKNKAKMDAEDRIKLFDKTAKKTSKGNKDPNNSEAWINWSNKRQNTMRNTINPIANLAYKKQEHSEHGPLVFKDNAMAFSTRKQNTIDHMIYASSTIPPSTKSPEVQKDARGGQKEVVLMRPATPVRRPFSEPVMELLAKQNQPERKRTPSVYDTIKHLLEMEKNLEEEYNRDEIRPPMRKRYVSSEESLVDQLSTLKKTA